VYRLTSLELATRRGVPPAVAGAGPREQLTQNAPGNLQEWLLDRVRTLPGVLVQPSLLCPEGSRACHLTPNRAHGPAEAFLIGTEFCHIHPVYDGSLHFALPAGAVDVLVRSGWAPRPDDADPAVLVYGPRNPEEAAVVWSIVRYAYGLALGPGAPVPR
jgi:hypothetical protein